MTSFQAVVLGLIQGLTEFIPVSSSGHLVLVPHYLNWHVSTSQTFIFDVLVQWGTLFAVFIYFRDELSSIIKATTFETLKGRPFKTNESRLGWFIVVATIPSVIIGLLFKSSIEAVFTNPNYTAIFLLLTAFLLILAEVLGERKRTTENMKWLDAIWIGCSQVLALLPGISRSGATIAGGMTRNFTRFSAAKFSFLMSVPVMIGAGILALRDLVSLPSPENFLFPLLIGFTTALISGYFAIRWLIAYLNSRSLYIFAAYCIVFGTLTLYLNNP